MLIVVSGTRTRDKITRKLARIEMRCRIQHSDAKPCVISVIYANMAKSVRIRNKVPLQERKRTTIAYV